MGRATACTSSISGRNLPRSAPWHLAPNLPGIVRRAVRSTPSIIIIDILAAFLFLPGRVDAAQFRRQSGSVHCRPPESFWSTVGSQ
jgi:hypothetical protein